MKREKYKHQVADGHKTREQDPVSITKADIQRHVSGTKNWTSPGPDVSPVCRLKKLTALLDHLTGQIRADCEGSAQGYTCAAPRALTQDRRDKEQEEELSWMTEPPGHTGQPCSSHASLTLSCP